MTSVGGVGWLIIGGFCSGVVVATAQFYAKGGGPHPRYLFSLVPVVSALMARALAELPWRRTALLVVVGGLLAVTASQLARYPDLIDDPTHNHPFADATAGLLAQSSAGSLVAGAFTALLAWLWADWWRGREARGETAPAGRSDGAGKVRAL